MRKISEKPGFWAWARQDLWTIAKETGFLRNFATATKFPQKNPVSGPEIALDARQNLVVGCVSCEIQNRHKKYNSDAPVVLCGASVMRFLV